MAKEGTVRLDHHGQVADHAFFAFGSGLDPHLLTQFGDEDFHSHRLGLVRQSCQHIAVTWFGMAPAAQHFSTEFRQRGVKLGLCQQPRFVLGYDLLPSSVLVDPKRIRPLAPLWKSRMLASDVDVEWLTHAVDNASRHHFVPSIRLASLSTASR